MANENTNRIVSIDLLRGIVMVIMALDHVRDFIHYGAFFSDPTDLATTTPAHFATRWITHFCAPVFVFLAGTAAYLYGAKQQTKKALSRFLFTRGLWLIFVEIVIVNFGINFDIHFSLIFLQVIWAIGICMLVLAALVYLPMPVIVAFGGLLVAGHNLLDDFSVTGGGPAAYVWYLLHEQNFIPTSPATGFFVVYPLIPWIGVMALGYGLGALYRRGYDGAKRRKLLWQLGLAATALFILLRTFNIYGEPSPWGPQDSAAMSVVSFLNLSKYPPSLLFLLMTLGPALLFLAWSETRFQNPMNAFPIIGRVPFFYYIVHFYLAHLAGVVGVLIAGRPWTDMILGFKGFTQPVLADYGYSLHVVYLVWLLVVVLLFPVCRWYDRYKRTNKDKWWLSYL